jgi:hypothetical protein
METVQRDHFGAASIGEGDGEKISIGITGVRAAEYRG